MVPKQVSKLELMQARIQFIPKKWLLSYVGKSYDIRNNLRKPISESERGKNPGRYPYYGPTKIQGHIGTYEQDEDVVTIGEDGDHFLKFHTQPMTMLISGKCTVNNHAHIIKGTSKASREWFYYYFMHRDIFSFLSRQGAGRYKLNKASLEKIPVLIPPLAEQKKIAKILSTWDKAISTTEQLLTNSQQQKKSLMQQLLTGKKRFPGFTDEWKEYKLSSLAKNSKKSFTDGDWIESPYISDSGCRLIQTGNIGIGAFKNNNKKYISFNSFSELKCTEVKEGDLLICRLAEPAGRACVVPPLGEKKMLTSVDVTIMDVDTNKSSASYLALYYSLEHTLYLVSVLCGGSTRSRVSRKNLGEMKFKLPSLKEQYRIVSILISADNEIENLQKQLEALKQEKKALMQQLLTGKRRVKIDVTEEASC